MRPSRKEVSWLVLTFVTAIFAKVALLLTSQRVLDADEAIIGLMALHITHGLSHPLFFYGQSYDAGAGVLAHAIAIASSISGVSAISVKATALGLWMVMVFIASNIVRTWIGWRAAGLTAALILWAPTSAEWAMKARGGHMLAVVLMLLTVGLALQDSTGSYGRSAAIGALAAAAVWAQPSSLPVIATVVGWLVVESLLKRRFLSPALLALGAAAVSIVPLAVLRTTGSTWSWQAFAGTSARHDPVLLVSSVLPKVFTRELDGSFPPEPQWMTVVGYVWLTAAAFACTAIVLALQRQTLTDRLRRPASILLAAACASPIAMFMVDSDYARPRILLALYPLACIAVAVVIDLWWRTTRRPWPALLVSTLVLSGIAVHAGSSGPPTIHGAGEQEQRLAGTVVDQMVADLDRHNVSCVFSQSPMLQWNLMFASGERIAARWITARDRWQPYVERVNSEFASGKRCALLLRHLPGDETIAQLQAKLGERSEQLTVFNDRYALLYDPSRQFIDAVFKADR